MSILFTNVTVLSMDGSRTPLPDAFVAVEGDSIRYVGQERPQGRFDRTVDGADKVMMPGFVNAHTHIPMTLMRGYGGGHDLQSWLHDYIFPAESRLDDRAVAAGAALGLAEMIATGVTCIADMYMHTPEIARQVMSAGISANLSCGGVYFGAPEDFSEERCGDCGNQRRLTTEWHGCGNGQIRVDASIHGEYTSNAPLWRWMSDYAVRHGLRMHAHVSETRSEHQGSLERNGKTPMQTLAEYGAWENGGIAAHCVYTTPEDWVLMAQKNVACVHNPWSNLKLGSGIAPVSAMVRAGVPVALGSDGMSSHNCADLFSDMKLAAALACGAGCDPLALGAWDVLEMATVGGARALGRTDTGVIAAGKKADLILLDFDAPNLMPCHDPAENLVYAAHPSNVVMNMARGRVIYENGAFTTIDLERVRREVKDYALPLIFGGRA
ncbi:MAG: amidohydrolase [Oscillospiraceae bacterium]|nr:amidohydrolase [Oscillospiraceae bacterium]